MKMNSTTQAVPGYEVVCQTPLTYQKRLKHGAIAIVVTVKQVAAPPNSWHVTVRSEKERWEWLTAITAPLCNNSAQYAQRFNAEVISHLNRRIKQLQKDCASAARPVVDYSDALSYWCANTEDEDE